jgi:hypothetical protein
MGGRDRRGGGLLRREPGAVTIGEDAVAARRFGETPRFDDAPVAHHGDPFAAPQRRQAVGGDQGRAARHEALDPGHDQRFGSDERRGRLVQDQDRRSGPDCSSRR